MSSGRIVLKTASPGWWVRTIELLLVSSWSSATDQDREADQRDHRPGPNASPVERRFRDEKGARPNGLTRACGGSCPLLQRLRVDRHLSQPLAGRREDSVGDAGTIAESWSPIPPAARSSGRCGPRSPGFVDAQHLVRVEVGLLDAAVLQRDLAIERGGDAEDDRALVCAFTMSGLTTVPSRPRRRPGVRGPRLPSRLRLRRPAPFGLEDGSEGDAAARPSGNGRPQPDFSAARSRTAFARGAWSRSARR